jgi:hypothetical protein
MHANTSLAAFVRALSYEHFSRTAGFLLGIEISTYLMFRDGCCMRVPHFSAFVGFVSMSAADLPAYKHTTYNPLVRLVSKKMQVDKQ